MLVTVVLMDMLELSEADTVKLCVFGELLPCTAVKVSVDGFALIVTGLVIETETGMLCDRHGAPFTHCTVTVAVWVLPPTRLVASTVSVITPGPVTFTAESAEVSSQFPPSVLVEA